MTSSMEVEPLVATAPDRVEVCSVVVPSSVVSGVSVSVLPQPARVRASRAEAARMLMAFLAVLFMILSSFLSGFIFVGLSLDSDKYSLAGYG